MSAETDLIEPDQAIQEKIQDVAKFVRESEQKDRAEEVFRAMIALDRTTRDDQPHLIRQLIWHFAQSTDEREAWTLPLVLAHLQIPKGAMVDAIAPIIGKTEARKLTEGVQLVARAIENGTVNVPPDLDQYQSHVTGILRGKLDDELGLVDHMFRRSPGDALQVFIFTAYRDERRKPLLWARHVVDDALWKRQYGFVPRKEPDAGVTEELEKMAGRDEWWARLYAAEIIRQHPEFGTDELVKRLADDPHALVQKSANAIRLPKRN